MSLTCSSPSWLSRRRLTASYSYRPCCALVVLLMCHCSSGMFSAVATSSASIVLPVPGSPLTSSGRFSVTAAFTASIRSWVAMSCRCSRTAAGGRAVPTAWRMPRGWSMLQLLADRQVHRQVQERVGLARRRRRSRAPRAACGIGEVGVVLRVLRAVHWLARVFQRRPAAAPALRLGVRPRRRTAARPAWEGLNMGPRLTPAGLGENRGCQPKNRGFVPIPLGAPPEPS